MTTLDVHWRDLADCQYVGDYLFYPDKGDAWRVRAAKRICGQCPVKTECLEDAMADEYGTCPSLRFGIRGGMSPRARADLSQQRGEPRRADTYFGHDSEVAA